MKVRFFAFLLIFSKFAKVFVLLRVLDKDRGEEDGHVDDGVFYALAAWCLSPGRQSWMGFTSFVPSCPVFLEQP